MTKKFISQSLPPLKLDLPQYAKAIETVKWLTGQMCFQDLQKVPDIHADFKTIRERLEFLARVEEMVTKQA